MKIVKQLWIGLCALVVLGLGAGYALGEGAVTNWRTNYLATVTYSATSTLGAAPSGVVLYDTQLRVKSGTIWIINGTTGGVSNGWLRTAGDTIGHSYPIYDSVGYTAIATGGTATVEIRQRGRR